MAKVILSSNEAVAHQWASVDPDSTRRGRTSNGNCSHEGATLYSYSTPIARHYRAEDGGQRIALLTSIDYSVTTKGKHLGAAHHAIPRDWRTLYVPRPARLSQDDDNANAGHFVALASANLQSAANRRKADLAARDVADAIRACGHLVTYLEALGIDPASDAVRCLHGASGIAAQTIGRAFARPGHYSNVVALEGADPGQVRAAIDCLCAMGKIDAKGRKRVTLALMTAADPTVPQNAWDPTSGPSIAFPLGQPADLTEWFDVTTEGAGAEGFAREVETLRRQREERERARREREAQAARAEWERQGGYRAECEGRLALWREHKIGSSQYGMPPGTYLRLSADGRRVETSRHADVPTVVARRLWDALREHRKDALPERVPTGADSGFQMRGFTQAPPNGFHHPDAEPDYVPAVEIGCHVIPLTEIDHVAFSLGLLGEGERGAGHAEYHPAPGVMPGPAPDAALDALRATLS